MRVIVNGREHELADGATVARLVEQLRESPHGRGVAVAVDAEVVPRSRLGQRPSSPRASGSSCWRRSREVEMNGEGGREPAADALEIAGRRWDSRLILGTRRVREPRADAARRSSQPAPRS